MADEDYAATPADDTAVALGITPGSVVLVARTRHYSGDGKLIEYAETTHPRWTSLQPHLCHHRQLTNPCYAGFTWKCQAPLSADRGCWHAPAMSVSAMFTLSLGCSPWRLRPAMAALQLPSRTVAAERHTARKHPSIRADVCPQAGCLEWRQIC